ncbi:probable glucuronosyltransferase Os03g0107900 [Asparagus officinalis]|uniref:probable glucuronosyltransferase Os03g0107900 n=1 Tax=Asparagus officinalis TaxID=4686 RepID=UPI00098E1504|nr:probable glucuronosyltransferase Os03g0107900 [Asparagus officinalis]
MQEDVAIADEIPEFLRRSILMQTFGVTSPHVCQEAEHVLIPPYIPPGILRSPPPETARRDIFVFFRGKMEVHPKNISGRFCSKYDYGIHAYFFIKAILEGREIINVEALHMESHMLRVGLAAQLICEGREWKKKNRGLKLDSDDA